MDEKLVISRYVRFKERIHEVEAKLQDEAVFSDMAKYRALSKEHSSLTEKLGLYNGYEKTKAEIEGLSELLSSKDEEIRTLAGKERDNLTVKKDELFQKLLLEILPEDEYSGRDIFVEIRAGAGGDEAALFAGDLFRMYTKFAERSGYKPEAVSSHPTGLGGFKEVIMMVKGKGAYTDFKFESGVHRVQRVPKTEASGRIHTSTVTVAVVPEALEVDIKINSEELRIDTFCASGKGGQSVNTTYSAVRITHLPTNTVVQCQDERSQIKNRDKAMAVLRSRLLSVKIEEEEKKIKDSRKKQVGTGDRSEKIRTYNFPQNRITDHRVSVSVYNMQDFLEGDMRELVNALKLAEIQETLSAS